MRMATRNRAGVEECRVSFDSHLDLRPSLDCPRRLRAVDLNQVHDPAIDLVGTSSIESTGLGLLISVRERWGQRGNVPLIRCVRGPVHEILSIRRMQRHFQVDRPN